jgi:hypothetical protein
MVETLVFVIPKFTDHTEERGSSFCADAQTTESRINVYPQWYLKIFPQGDKSGNDVIVETNDDETTDKKKTVVASTAMGKQHVSVHLKCIDVEDDHVYVRTEFSLNSHIQRSCRCVDYGVSKQDYWAVSDFVERQRLLEPSNKLLSDEGTMVIHVRIEWLGDSFWRPRKEMEEAEETLTRLSRNLPWSDVTFSVGGKLFRAHKCILAVNAPGLLLDMKGTDGPFELDGVDVSAFECVLAASYNQTLPHDLRQSSVQAISSLLRVANRFDCKRLKHLVENIAVESIIEAINAADFLPVADSFSCALLEEAAMDEIARAPHVVFSSKGWDLVKKSEHLMMKVIRAGYCKPTEQERTSGVADHMTVGSLRSRLEERGFDVDGTREMLVKQLKTSMDENPSDAEEIQQPDNIFSVRRDESDY